MRAAHYAGKDRRQRMQRVQAVQRGRGLTFDMSGAQRARSGLWDVRSMEGLGAADSQGKCNTS